VAYYSTLYHYQLKKGVHIIFVVFAYNKKKNIKSIKAQECKQYPLGASL